MPQLEFRQDSAYQSIWQLIGQGLIGYVDVNTTEFCPRNLVLLTKPYDKTSFVTGILGMAKIPRNNYSEFSQVAAYRSLMSGS